MNTRTFGLITDLHYARRATGGTREYARSLDKLRTVIGRFNAANVPLLFVLGDLIDAPEDAAHERAALDAIVEVLRTFGGEVHVLAGNHDLVNFTKPQFLAACGQGPVMHRAFEHAGVRMILLDGCYKRDDSPYGGAMMDWTDAKVSDAQLPFLSGQLRQARGADQPAVVLMHQTLVCPHANHNVANNAQVLDMLAESGVVALAISGHYHKGGLEQVNGVTCFTLPATVETSVTPDAAGRIVTVRADRTFDLG